MTEFGLTKDPPSIELMKALVDHLTSLCLDCGGPRHRVWWDCPKRDTRRSPAIVPPRDWREGLGSEAP